jgi:hypothetical protein
MRRHAVLLLSLAVLLLAAAPALAWNALGHKVVAEIAWRGLTSGQRKSIVDTLKRHPRFAEDFIGRMPKDVELAGQVDQDQWIFQHAATWPDIARGIRGDARDVYDHPTWHYVNGPIYVDPSDKRSLAGKIDVNLKSNYPTDLPPERWNVLQATKHALEQIKDDATPVADKAVAYCWLFHLVGDSHQPMHSCALFSANRFPEGDRGGNDIPLLQGKKLHALWDNFLGSSHKLRSVDLQAGRLDDRDKYGRIWDDAGKQLDIREWIKESYALAKNHAYDPAILAVVRRATPQQPLERIDLSQEYLKSSGAHARERILAAGVRLAALLDGLVPKDSVTEPPVFRLPASSFTSRATSSPSSASPSSSGSHWLNTNTGERHNSSCRWYRNTKNGRMCGPNEGDTCEQCGG